MLKPEHYPLTMLLDLKVNAMTVVGTATGEILVVSFLLLDYTTLQKPKQWTVASDYMQVPAKPLVFEFRLNPDGTPPEQVIEVKTYKLEIFRIKDGDHIVSVECVFVPELNSWFVRK